MSLDHMTKATSEVIARCPHCGWGYPDWYLNPIVGDGATPPICAICAICALAHINQVHGMRRRTFTGTQAESNRQDALEWRRKHPERKPGTEVSL